MKEVAIKEICTKGSSSLKQKELLPEGEYPVYGASGIAGYLDTFHQESNYIGIVKDGSGIGRVAFYPEKTSLIGTMQYILPKKGFNIRYIGYCLQSLDLSKYKQGAAIPHIYFRDYGERIVKVTDDENEQLSIVSRLDAAFVHIDALKANAEKQLAEARQLFQAELTECMRPKEGWEEKKMSDLYDVRDGTHDSPKYQETGYPLVTSKSLRGGVLDMSNVSLISEEDYKAINYRSKVNIGDVLFAMIGTIGNPVYVQVEPNYAIKNMALFKVPSNQSGEFLKYYLLNEHVLLKMQTESKGTTQKFVSLGYLRNFLMTIPSLTEQKEIVSRLDALSSNIKKLEEVQRKTLAECDALKQAMLREVFE